MTVESGPLPIEKFETRMVLEASQTAISLFLEEVSRQMLRIGIEDQAKQFLATACSFAGSISFHLLGTQDAVADLWGNLRTQSGLFDVVMRTTVKLRGMYTRADWDALVTMQADAVRILNEPLTVADSAVKTHFPTSVREGYLQGIIAGNPWLVTLMLIDHLSVNIAPSLLSPVMKEISKAKSPEVKQQ